MNPEDIEKFLKSYKEGPKRRTILLYGVLIILLFVYAWANGFLGEKGRQQAAINPSEIEKMPETVVTDPRQSESVKSEPDASVETKVPPEEMGADPEVSTRKTVSAVPDDAIEKLKKENVDSYARDVSRGQSTIRETSAAEVVRSVRAIEYPNDLSETIDSLYMGRWTREPDWRGIVDELPNQHSNGEWALVLKENNTDTLIFVTTEQDVSTLRPGDQIGVTGRISRVSINNSVSLEDASISFQQ